MSAQAVPSVVSRPAPYGRILISGVVFGVLVMVPALVVYWALRLVGVPFEVVSAGDTTLTLVGTWQVMLAPIVAGFLGALLAGTFRTLTNGPRFAALSLTALTLASCAAPLMQPASVATSTRVSLIVLHLLVGGVLTWAISRAVTSEDPPVGIIEQLDSRHPGAGTSSRR